MSTTIWNVFTSFNGSYAAGSHSFVMRFENDERMSVFEKWANKAMYDAMVTVTLYCDEEIREIELHQSARLGGSPFVPNRFEIFEKPLTNFDNNLPMLQSKFLKAVKDKDVLWEIDNYPKFYEKAMKIPLF